MADLTPNALAVLERRYLRRDDAGQVCERPAEMWRRVARVVAAAEAAHGGDPVEAALRFEARMAALEFLPNSPTLMNAGRERGQLAACFVLPVGDSIDDIFDAIKWAAEIQMTGGGTGFSFSRIRPAGDLVASTRGVASGPVSFMEVFNAATDAIKQGGMRRGANMGILRVDHPDILAFVACKTDPARMRNFNLSVAVSDAFMAALAAGDEGGDDAYPLRNPRTGVEVGRLPARRVWDLVCEAAWATAEPGVVFIDRVNAQNPTPRRGPMEATNPCAELPLLPFEACNLGSINVARFLAADRRDLDWDRLGDAIDDGVRFLDDVIDANHYVLPQIAEVTRGNRKIGLGVMGFADALCEMDVPYDSPDALAVAGRLAAFLDQRSIAASRALARERGAFPHHAGSVWDVPGAAPMRNATTTSIAPTGTISLIAGCSSGIEPIYALSLVRRVLEGTDLPDVHPGFRAEAERRGFWTPAVRQAVAERGGVRGLPDVPDDVQRRYVVAHEVPAEQHVRIQAAFQHHIQNAISKTINLPESATRADVDRSLRLAYRLGCKGVTVYRDGVRAEQVLSCRSPEPPAACPA